MDKQERRCCIRVCNFKMYFGLVGLQEALTDSPTDSSFVVFPLAILFKLVEKIIGYFQQFY